MNRSQKPHTRANLYRARRKLKKSLAAEGGVFASDRDLPEQWGKPKIGGAARPRSTHAKYDLRVSATPAEGVRLDVGDVINPLTLSVRPQPEPGSTASFRVRCGDIIRGPYTVPVDEDGHATGFVTIEKEFEKASSVTVEWYFKGETITATWPLR